jgi:hypothetical protein
LKLITESSRKYDRVDAEMPARVDQKLLRPTRHRGEKAQMDTTSWQIAQAAVCSGSAVSMRSGHA